MADNDPVHSLHEFALEARIRLFMRTGKADAPQGMWALATGAAASWALHRALERLSELDPAGAQKFASELAEELEFPDYAEDPCDAAARLGLNAQQWIDHEHALRDAA